MFEKIVFGLCLVGYFTIGANGQISKKNKFSCKGRVTGYYADVSSGCQNYHMCDGLGRQFSYACPNATLFQQRMLICDHWYMVNCSKSESEYGANVLIGQRGKLFLDDSEQNPYRRTPRPDLSLLPTSQEYNIIYRTGTGRDQSNDINLVGVHSENDTSTGKYSPPSHWSTEYAKPATEHSKNNRFTGFTESPTYRTKFNAKDYTSTNDHHVVSNDVQDDSSRVTVNFKSDFIATTPVYPTFFEEPLKFKNIELEPPKSGSGKKKFVNYESDFKATTPVYPKFVEDRFKGHDIELSLPLNDQDDSETQATIKVNFISNFKATTPVYPTFVEESLKMKDVQFQLPKRNNKDNFGNANVQPQTVKVNFKSDFKATTPVYPLFVAERVKESNNNLDLLPPPTDESQKGVPNTNDPNVVVNFPSNFKATTPVYPKFVEATSPVPSKVGLVAPDSTNESQEDQKSIVINFASDFKATTPVYPTTVDQTSPIPDRVGLVPPSRIPENGSEFGPENASNSHDKVTDYQMIGSDEDIRPVIPSKFYQPPKFLPDFISPTEKVTSDDLVIDRSFFVPKLENIEWGQLRKTWFIPEYDFPLDSANSRPKYDSNRQDSFQVDAASVNAR